MKRNIFIREYNNALENILTECLLDYLSNSNIKILNNFLHRIKGFKAEVKDINNVKFEMQHKEKDSIPDASIYDERGFYIHIEVKRFEHSLGALQLENHLKGLEEKIQKRKYLLVITNDYGEPKEFLTFRHRHSSNEVKVAFLAWSEIYDFVKGIPKSICNEKDRFLKDQYLEYLEEERMKIAKWSGFNQQSKAVWLNFLQFFTNQELLFRDIKKHLEKKVDWEEIAATPRPSYFEIAYNPWKLRSQKINFYTGLQYLEKEKDGEIVVHVQWVLNDRLKQKLRTTDKFMILKERLTNRNYVERWNGNYFEKRLSVKELVKIKHPELQRARY